MLVCIDVYQPHDDKVLPPCRTNIHTIPISSSALSFIERNYMIVISDNLNIRIFLNQHLCQPLKRRKQLRIDRWNTNRRRIHIQLQGERYELPQHTPF